MTNTNKEKLSAFVDDELIEQTLISDLLQDPQCVQAWKNYHLIGDTMRGDAPISMEWDIAGEVARRLENEAPLNMAEQPISNQDNVVSIHKNVLSISKKARVSLPKWPDALAQVAVAASVTFGIIFSVQQYSGQQNGIDAANNQAGTFPVLQTVPFSGSVEPVSLRRDNVKSNRNEEVQLLEQRRRINAMLQDYELQLKLNDDATTSVTPLSLHE